jgi:hypothetical protein
LAAPALWSSRARQCVETCRVDGLGGRQIDCVDRGVAAAGLFEQQLQVIDVDLFASSTSRHYIERAVRLVAKRGLFGHQAGQLDTRPD